MCRLGEALDFPADLVHVAEVAKAAFSGRHEIPASARRYLPIGDNGVTLLRAPSFSILSGLLIDGLPIFLIGD